MSFNPHEKIFIASTAPRNATYADSTIMPSATLAVSRYNLPFIGDDKTYGEEARINSFCSGASILDYYNSLLPSANTSVQHTFRNVDIRLQDEALLCEPELQTAPHDMTLQRAPRGPPRLSEPLVVLLVRLLMQLEINALDQTQSSIDCGAANLVNTVSGSLLLHRLDAEGPSFHISLILCTGSRCKGITVKCTIILFFFPASSRFVESSRMRIWCSCNEFQISRPCSHVSGIRSSRDLEARLMRFGSRSIVVSGIEGEGPWSVTKYPTIGQGDEALAWQVFWRSNLLFGMRTSAAVVLDNRRSRKHLPLKFRVRCTICDGSAQNRGVCVHESKCLKAIRQICAAYIESGIVNGGTDDKEGSIDEYKSSGTIDYCSSAIRRFFPCRSEDDAVLQTLREIQDILNNN